MLASGVLAPTVARLFAATAPLRWNVLIITNDQHRADCLGCMGNPVILTPNIDSLARQGVIFERHFVQAPQCVPSRSALHTGRYPHVNRTPTNIYRLPETEETLANILGRNGYTAATVGELPFAPTKFLGGLMVFADDSGTLWLRPNDNCGNMSSRSFWKRSITHCPISGGSGAVIVRPKPESARIVRENH